MDVDEIDKILRTESVFREDGQKTLAQAWVPSEDQKLLCRDDEIKELLSIHRPIITSKDPFSVNTLIVGKGGIGKTVTSKFFGGQLKRAALKNNNDLFIEYYDCLQHRTKSSILRDITKKLLKYSTGHGYSDNEILEQVLMHLKKAEKYVLIILDEVQNLPQEDIMSFVNASIGFGEKNARFSLILISREYDWYRVEDEKIASRIQHKIKFTPYNRKEAFEILNYRRKLAFREGVLEDEELQLIADIVDETKNMRNGVDIMRACGTRADQHSLGQITSEMILQSRQTISSTFRQSVVDNLKEHEKISLLAIARALDNIDDPYVMVDEAYEHYQMICEEMEKRAHVKMSFRKYIRQLRDLKVVRGDYVNPSKEEKGRRLELKLLDITPEKLIEYLEPRLIK